MTLLDYVNFRNDMCKLMATVFAIEVLLYTGLKIEEKMWPKFKFSVEEFWKEIQEELEGGVELADDTDSNIDVIQAMIYRRIDEL